MEFLKIGQIVSTHGIKGEVKVYVYTDDIKNLARTKSYYLDDVKFKVTKTSIFKNMLIVKLDGINSKEEAKSCIGKYLYIEKKNIEKEDTYYVEDLIGVKVYKRYTDEEDYKYLGVISYVYTSAANDVYEVRLDNNTNVYIPAIKDVVKIVDIKKKEMYIKMMEGLE